jgi:hypothetical protein
MTVRSSTEASALEHELRTYSSHRRELLARGQGKWVLIHGDRVLDIFDTQMDAISRGYRELGAVPFLVKQILQVEEPEFIVSNLLTI